MPFREPTGDGIGRFREVIERYAALISRFQGIDRQSPTEPEVQVNYWRPGVMAFRSTRLPERIVDEFFDHDGQLEQRITTEIRHEGELVTDEWFADRTDPRVLQTVDFRFVQRSEEGRILINRRQRFEQRCSCSACQHRARGHQFEEMRQLFESQQVSVPEPVEEWGREPSRFGQLIDRAGLRGDREEALRERRNRLENGARYQRWEIPLNGRIGVRLYEEHCEGRSNSRLAQIELPIVVNNVDIRSNRGELTTVDVELLGPAEFAFFLQEYFPNGQPFTTINGFASAVVAQVLSLNQDSYGMCCVLLRLYPCHIDQDDHYVTVVVQVPESLQSTPAQLPYPKICVTCQNFHGQAYSGKEGRNFLVCGMHPYGNGDDCSDFEAKI